MESSAAEASAAGSEPPLFSILESFENVVPSNVSPFEAPVGSYVETLQYKRKHSEMDGDDVGLMEANRILLSFDKIPTTSDSNSIHPVIVPGSARSLNSTQVSQQSQIQLSYSASQAKVSQQSPVLASLLNNPTTFSKLVPAQVSQSSSTTSLEQIISSSPGQAPAVPTGWTGLGEEVEGSPVQLTSLLLCRVKLAGLADPRLLLLHTGGALFLPATGSLALACQPLAQMREFSARLYRGTGSSSRAGVETVVVETADSRRINIRLDRPHTATAAFKFAEQGKPFCTYHVAAGRPGRGWVASLSILHRFPALSTAAAPLLADTAAVARLVAADNLAKELAGLQPGRHYTVRGGGVAQLLTCKQCGATFHTLSEHLLHLFRQAYCSWRNYLATENGQLELAQFRPRSQTMVVLLRPLLAGLEVEAEIEPGGQIVCSTCRSHFTYLGAYLVHQDAHLSKGRVWTCPHCALLFLSAYWFCRHSCAGAGLDTPPARPPRPSPALLYSEAGTVSLDCPSCSRSYPNLSALLHHLQLGEPCLHQLLQPARLHWNFSVPLHELLGAARGGMVQCKVCSLVCPTALHYLLHADHHLLDCPIPCPTCQASCPTLCSLYTHSCQAPAPALPHCHVCAELAASETEEAWLPGPPDPPAARSLAEILASLEQLARDVAAFSQDEETDNDAREFVRKHYSKHRDEEELRKHITKGSHIFNSYKIP